jgi:hypothetical protein
MLFAMRSLYLLTTVILLDTIAAHASPQFRPFVPPDVCYRRNDSLPACPYGGQCLPTANYTCQTSCVDYQAIDSRFFCNVKCGYKATSLGGSTAPNPLLCIQPTLKNGITCDSGWACYRKFGTKPPLYRTQGPVCSPHYTDCDPKAPQVPSSSSNATGDCDAGKTCIVDPRVVMAKPLKMDDVGICVSNEKTCSGKKWDECGDLEHCVPDPRYDRSLGSEYKGICVKVLGLTWGTVNGTTVARRWMNRGMC